MDQDVVLKLIKAAKEVMAHSYCPYSNFPVGCALLCEDGSIYTGCNIENAAFSGSICAERTAYVKALSSGQRKFKAAVVTSNLIEDFCAPCGNCRQFMTEFGTDLLVILAKNESNYQTFYLHQLLPHSFGPKNLSDFQLTVQNNN